MTIQGVIADLRYLFEADDVPFYYKGGIEKIIETIQMELADRTTESTGYNLSPVEDEPQTDVYDYKGNGKWERSE